MNRTKTIVGCTLVVLAAACIGQMILDKPAKPRPKESAPEQTPPPAPQTTQVETQPVSADEVVETFIPSLKDGDEQSRLVALGGLVDVLQGPEYAKSPIGHEKGQALAEAIAPLVVESSGEAKETWALKVRAAKIIVGRTKAPQARELALKALETGPADLTQAVASELGRPEGIGGRKIFHKLEEVSSKLPVPIAASALRRTGGKKGVEPITALLRSSNDPDAIAACVIALEDYQDPALLGPALERLEQTGVIDDGAKLPWISVKLLNAHVETAEGAALMRGVKVLRARPTLARHGAAIFERAFEKGDDETRRIAAEAVKKAVMAKTFDQEAAEKLVAAHPAPQPAPVLKAQLPDDKPKQQ